MGSLFELRGNLSSKQKLILEVLGAILILGVWYLITGLGLVSKLILPMPHEVIMSFSELHFEDALVRNVFFSLKLNFLGYLEAVAVSLPLGFMIGLFPISRGLMERYVNALRYLPLTAAMGLFIAWFGIASNMKVQFLAFGIFVYLMPVVAQRVYEVQQIYVDTVKTLGASRWQTIKSVFIPDVFSRVSSDIIVLVAISWTYIIIAEIVNSSQGGVGALANIAARQSRTDKVFAVLLVIMIIGFLQDKIFTAIDRLLFRHKYV